MRHLSIVPSYHGNLWFLNAVWPIYALMISYTLESGADAIHIQMKNTCCVCTADYYHNRNFFVLRWSVIVYRPSMGKYSWDQATSQVSCDYRPILAWIPSLKRSPDGSPKLHRRPMGGGGVVSQHGHIIDQPSPDLSRFGPILFIDLWETVYIGNANVAFERNKIETYNILI